MDLNSNMGHKNSNSFISVSPTSRKTQEVSDNSKYHVVILAAGEGTRMGEIGGGKPKSFLEIGGKKVLEHSLDYLNGFGIKEVTLVLGFMKDSFVDNFVGKYKGLDIDYVYLNDYIDDYKRSNHGWGFFVTKKRWARGKKDMILMDADNFFDPLVLDKVMKFDGDNVIIVDDSRKIHDREEELISGKDGIVSSFGRSDGKKFKDNVGEFIGVSKFSSGFLEKFYEYMDSYFKENDENVKIEKLLNQFIKNSNVCLNYINSEGFAWVNLNHPIDLEKARGVVYPKIVESQSQSKKVLDRLSWDKVWEDKGNNVKEFDPIELDGFEVSITDISREKFLESMTGPIKEKLDLNEKDDLFEMGCGAGMVLIPLSKHTKSASGGDLSSSLIRRLKENYPEFDLYVCGGDNLPLENEKYNKILVHGVFHYFPNLEYGRAVVNELIRICKQGGKILIADVNDLEKKEACLAFFNEKEPEKYKLNPLQHLFYPKQFFSEICRENGLKYEIYNQESPYNKNAPFRFNVLIEKT